MKVEESVKIGSFILKNRMTFAPTVKFDYAGADGKVQDISVDHYRERAEGGCALICVESNAVLPEGRFSPNHLGIYEDSQIEGHKRIVDACHENGALVIVQLNHAGYRAGEMFGPIKGPSTMEFEGKQTTSMSIEEIHFVQKAFVNAALRAKKAGYDGVQIHCCHIYLINQFMSLVTNHRDDEYGYSCIENRARFGAEIIREIRTQCGHDFMISCRVAGLEPTLEDSIAIAEEYVKAGCDYLQVSSGATSLELLPEYKDSNIPKLRSLGLYFYEHFKGKVPVSCVGGITNPNEVTYLFEHGYCDTVDLARSVLADPSFPMAVIDGRDYQKCFGCSICQYSPNMPHKCPAKTLREQNS